jgi:hypothetical protein
MISALKKPLDRKKMRVIYALSLGCICVIVGGKSLITSRSSSQWQKATDIATVAQIDKVLKNNIDPLKLDRKYIMNTLPAQKVGSFMVYRFTYPETTFPDGSLYVISDNYDKEKPILLWDSPRFSPLTQSPYCLEVVQRGQEYTICP